MNLTNKIGTKRISNAVAAGTSTITPSASVDCSNADGVRFIIGFGAIVTGAVTSIKIVQSSDDGVVDGFSDLAGSNVTVADDGDNKLVIIDVYRPGKKNLKPVISRATQNATVDFIIAELYGGRNEPMKNDAATVLGTPLILASPVEGTP